MSNIKKLSILVIFTLIFSVILIGCSREDLRIGKQKDVIEISYGHGFMPDTPHHKSALKFKEEVEKKTNGKVVVNVFPSSQLGSAREMFEGLQIGTQEMALVPTARISGFAPELQLFDLPFLFPSRESAYGLMDGKVGTELLDTLKPQAVKGVAFYEDGFKHFTSNKKLEDPADFKGVKFRTMESPIVMNQFRALGSNPTPIDFSELYNSLQLGVVDGQENPLVTIENMKFYEVQKHLTLSSHAYLGHVLIFSEKWFEEQTEELQEILYEVGREVAVWQRAEVQKEETEYLQTIKEGGTTVTELTDEQKAVLEEVTRPVHKEYVKMFGDELLNKVYDELQKLHEKE